MSRRSLRLRLLLAAAVSIALALVVAGFGWVRLFERHVERRLHEELEIQLQQLAASIVFDAGGKLRLKQQLADPRFNQVYGGLYWQLLDGDSVALRSRSLWDSVLPLPQDPLDLGIIHEHDITGPQGATLLVRERRLVYTTPAGPRTVRLAVAVDRAELDRAVADFAADLLPSLAVLGVVLVAAAWLQVVVGLRPLEAVRRNLAAVRSFRQRRLARDYPDEVMPLVEEVNSLLEAQEQAIARARAHAADLAHGLKTPLTVLAADASRLKDKGETEIAAELDELADSMRRHVDRELARARIGVGRGFGEESADVGSIADRIVRTLQRSPKGETLRWEVEVVDRAIAAVDPQDLAELLGNLLENAVKWARQRVWLIASAEDEVTIVVEDDGPGVPEEQLDDLGRRGLRLDSGVPGAGQGLAIVGEIVAAYRGGLSLSRGEAGGLKATATLPRASSG